MSTERLAIWPSIDLREGRVVRLLRGDWDAGTEFEGDPVEIAERFEREGADGLHVVDLDAAFGKGTNAKEIGEILAANPDSGAGRGRDAHSGRRRRFPGKGGYRTRGRWQPAVPRPSGLHTPSKQTLVFLSLFSWLFVLSRLVVALDCRDGRPTVRGWTEDARAGDAVSVARDFAALGVRALLVTDVAHDGAMAGPNLGLLASIRAVFHGEILASGGMRGPEDLPGVDRVLGGGPRGAIFGRALHGGATTVAALVEARGAAAGRGR